MKKTVLILSLALTLGSCMVTRTTIGAGPIGNDPNTQIFSKVKQGYLIRGLVPLGSKQANLPPSGAYQVKTSHKFGDALISVITFGIYSQQTIEIIIKK